MSSPSRYEEQAGHGYVVEITRCVLEQDRKNVYGIERFA